MNHSEALYSKAILIGAGTVLALLFTFSRYPGLNPFNTPYERLLRNTELLNETINDAVNEQNEDLVFFMKTMRADIRDEILNEAKMANKGLLDTIAEIDHNKDSLLAQIDEHIETLKMSGELNPETGKLEKPGNISRNRNYWLGASQKGEELYQKVQNFYDELKIIYNAQLWDEEMVIEGRKVSANSPERWAKESFSYSIVESISVLERLKLEIIAENQQLFELLNTRLGSCVFRTDRVMNVSVPHSEIVVAGMDFKASLLPVLNYPNLHPDYTSANGEIEQKLGEITKLTIPTDVSVIPEGQSSVKQKYSGSLKLLKATGGYEVVDFEESFTVRRPQVLISYPRNQALYRQCENVLKIDVPDFGDNYHPHVEAVKATVITSEEDQTLFTISPEGPEAILQISNLNNDRLVKIEDKSFRVIEPPKPTIELYVNGRRYNGYSKINASSKLTIKLIGDPYFKASFPNDAEYGTSGIDILAQPGLGAPMVINRIKNQESLDKAFSLTSSEKTELLKEGVRVYIRMNGIYRKNFAGEKIIDKRFSEVERTIGLTIK